MSETKSERQRRLLGRSFGSAFNRLRKMLLFKLATNAGLAICHRCGKQIETLDEFSIEHKNSWERAGDPAIAFFDLDNVAFSHFICNSGAAFKSVIWKTGRERTRAGNMARAKRRCQAKVDAR